MTDAVRTALFLMLVAMPAPPALAQESKSYKGMLLADVLLDLQARGLRIIFSSALVRSELRVTTESRATTPRQQLDELLAPLGLEAREGPGGVLQIVRAMTPKRDRLETRGALEGRVVDGLTTAPLQHVHIRVDGHPEEAQTDAAGQFAMKQLAKGARIVTASAVGYTPARRTVGIDAGSMVNVTFHLFPETRRYQEFVSVTDSTRARREQGIPSELGIEASDLEHLHGSVAEDPLRVVQAFPSVTAIDDFQSAIAVRGSPFRHVDLVVDGVSTHWLRHTAFGRGAVSSLTMLSSLVVERATLRSGAYPRRYGDRLGSELSLLLRQGSRSEFSMRGAVGGAHAVLAAEGPLGDTGQTGSARGSWLVGGRQSYLEWPPERYASSRTPFGFSDALAKVVFDIRPRQQLTVTAIRGVSTVDQDDDDGAPMELTEAVNSASAVSLSWQLMFGPTFLVRQQGSVVTQRASNAHRDAKENEGRASRALTYRAELVRSIARGMLEAGGLVEQIRTRQSSRQPEPFEDASTWLRSGYVHFSWPATPSVTVSPGLRVTWSTLTPTPVVSRWLLGEWSFRRGWSVIASTGSSRQLPELYHLLGEMGSPNLRPERAVHLDLGVEQQLTSGVRWQVTTFARREADVIWSPNRHPRLLANDLVLPDAEERYTNALRGTSHGIELVVGRQSPYGLSGWATYAYARTRQSDTAREETYWADFDQRHTLNALTQYRFSAASVGATLRAGSNFPIPGYFAMTNGRMLVGHPRNQLRLPPYVRLDVRADRKFHYFSRTFTLFVEGLNVLDRQNIGVTDGSVDPVTGEATGFTDTLLRRRISAGIVFEF